MDRGQYDKPLDKVTRGVAGRFPTTAEQGEYSRLDLARSGS